MSNYYNILNVDKNSTIDEIKKQYKKLAVKYHPDKGGDPEEFKKISEAYSVLSDESKRYEYDNTNNLASFINLNNENPINIFDIFINNNNIFSQFDNLNNESSFNTFTTFNNSFNNTNGRTTSVFISGNKKIQKTIEFVNGKRIETIKTINLSNGKTTIKRKTL